MSNGFAPLTLGKIAGMVNAALECLHHGDVDHAVTGLLMLRQWIEEDYAIDQLQSLGELNGNDHHIN